MIFFQLAMFVLVEALIHRLTNNTQFCEGKQIAEVLNQPQKENIFESLAYPNRQPEPALHKEDFS